MKNMANLNYAFIEIGVVFLLLAIINLYRYKFWKKQIMVNGRVVDTYRTHSKYGSHYHLTYHYTDKKAKQHTASGSVDGRKEYQKGKRIKIYYDAKNSEHSILFDRTEELLPNAKGFFVVMFLCVFMGVIEAFV